MSSTPSLRPRNAGAPLPERALWVNGRIVRGRDAQVSLFDRGTRDGEGIFETVRVEGGHAHHWRHHLERMVLAAAELGFPVIASGGVTNLQDIRTLATENAQQPNLVGAIIGRALYEGTLTVAAARAAR